MISENTSSPVAAPKAAESGSKSMASVSGMNRKNSTDSSTMPIWTDGMSSEMSVARPYSDMDSTNTMSFCDCVAPCSAIVDIAVSPLSCSFSVPA